MHMSRSRMKFICVYLTVTIYTCIKKNHHINAQKQILHVICLLKFNIISMVVIKQSFNCICGVTFGQLTSTVVDHVKPMTIK
jgi:hypothetical protein